MTEHPDVVSVERIIPAPAERIFALVADPTQHHTFDGSGTVRDAKVTGSDPLQLGSTFGMHMKLGFPYSMVNTVVEFEPNRRIAWQTRPPGVFAKLFGGRIWRYELEPADGGTLVRESWDIREEKPSPAVVRRAATHTAKNMEQTLARIEQVVTG
jgi:uncharacterized protein YndB with AHSA1/START domain